MALSGWLRKGCPLLDSRVTKWVTCRMNGRQEKGDGLGRFGHHGIDAEESALAAHARAQLVFIGHLGEKDVGQGLRAREAETRPAPGKPG